MVVRSFQVDAVSGARLVGGEMLQWSDFERGVTPGISHLLLRHLASRLSRGGRVLVVGPRAARSFEQMPDGAEVDVLVRGLPDARQLTSVAQLRPGVTVYCGGIDRFEPPAPYDLVVALDGPNVLLTPDSHGTGQREILQRMGKWLSPDGALVAVVENDLGFDRLFRAQPRRGYDDDAWDRGGPGFDQRPLYYRELTETLTSADLGAQAVYAAFPSADDVGLLVTSEGVEDQELADVASALVAKSGADHFAERPALVDAYDVALRLFESGHLMALASAWLVVATPAGAALRAGHEQADEGRAAEPAPALPALLAADATGRDEWRAVRSVERRGEAWTHRLHPVVPMREMRERRVVRSYASLETAVVGGATLEAALRRACDAHDVVRVRELVGRYAGWLGRVPQDVAEGDVRFFAVPANVLLSDGELSVFDSTWRFTQALSHEVLLVRGLRDFARRLLRSGAEHPWAPDINPDRLAQTLAAMTGVEMSRGTVDAVARLEAEVDVVLAGGDSVAESTAYGKNLATGQSQFVAQSGPVRAYREALATSGRLAQALDDKNAQVEWLVLTLRARDRRLGDLEHQLTSVRESASFKIGRFFTWPVRALVQGLRRVALSALPPGFLNRAMRAAKRLVGGE